LDIFKNLSHSLLINDKSFENAAKFKHFGTKVTNQNCIQEKIKSRLNSGHACKTMTLPVVLYGCETWSLRLREEHSLTGCENREEVARG
jgi:hypothetical protein